MKPGYQYQFTCLEKPGALRFVEFLCWYEQYFEMEFTPTISGGPKWVINLYDRITETGKDGSSVLTVRGKHISEKFFDCLK